MRILVATGLYPPEIGGPATHVKLLEKHLPKEHFTLITIPYGRVRHIITGFQTLWYFWLLFRASRGVHAIYALDPLWVGLPALLVSKLRRKPFILRLGGDHAWEIAVQRYGITDPLAIFVSHQSTYPLLIRALSSGERFVARSAQKVIVPSEHLKKILLQWGVKKDNLTVLYSVFEPRTIQEERGVIRKMFQYEGPVIFSAGRLVSWKGFKTLIEILPALKETLESEVTLVIAGDGPERPELEATAKELGLAGKVRFLGSQAQDTLLTAIHGADVFVLNAGYSGFAHQLLEVMNIRTPIVTTAAGVNPELITDGVHGLLVPYNDRSALVKAIATIVTHEDLRQKLTGAAHARVQKYSIEHMIEGLSLVLLEYVPAFKVQNKY